MITFLPIARILDHFDAVKVALTSPSALHTVQIFGDPVYRYTYRTAVIDGYLIDQDPPIQITTRNAQDGVYLAQGEQVERISSQGEVINDTLEDEQDFEVADFNRNLIIPAFNRAVCNELTNYLDPTGLQKTLVFCVTNAHADMVVEELRIAFKKKIRSWNMTRLSRLPAMPIKTRVKCRRSLPALTKSGCRISS